MQPAGGSRLPTAVPELHRGSPESSDGEEGEEGPWVGVWEEKGMLELSPAGAARSCPSLAQGAPGCGTVKTTR